MSLAEDLVTAAAQAMQGATYGPATKRKARLAVVAALRRLVEEERDWQEHQLAGLADEIEIRSALSEDIESERSGVPQAEKPQP